MSTSIIESALNTLIAEMRQLTVDGNEKDLDKLVKDTAKKLSKKLSKNEEPKKVKGKKTVYQIFCAKNRDTTLSFIDANRAISTKWKALNDEEKAEFAASVQSEIDADVERFNEEKASSSDEASSDEKGEKKKTKKDPNAPKRPLGSFMLFCKEQREEHSDLKGVDGTKRISESWNALSASAKEVYTNKAKVLMDAFKGKPVEAVNDVDIASKMEAAEKSGKKSKKVDDESSDEKPEKVEKEKKKSKKVDDESSDEKPEKVEKEKSGKKSKKVEDESSDEKPESVEKKTKKAKKVAE